MSSKKVEVTNFAQRERWSIGQVVKWSIGQVVKWLIGQLVNSVNWLIAIRKKGEVAAGLCRFAIKKTSHFKNKRTKLQTSPSGTETSPGGTQVN